MLNPLRTTFTLLEAYTVHTVVLTKILFQPLCQNVLFSLYCHKVLLLQTGQSGASEVAETCIFLASI